MEGGVVNELLRLYFADQHAVLVNSNGGFYQRGKSYAMETKLFVAAKYLDHKGCGEDCGQFYQGLLPNAMLVGILWQK